MVIRIAARQPGHYPFDVTRGASVRFATWTLGVTWLVGSTAACSDGPVLKRRTLEPTDDVVIIVDYDAGPDRVPLVTDPHAVLGVDPTHGPFSGGQLAVIRGNGFSSEARVWFGGEELSQDSVTPLDPNRIQVRVPAGAAGPVDVGVQIGEDSSTRRTLVDGYEYDAFSVEPSSGSTLGGTSITLVGAGLDWTEATTVLVDRAPCDVVEVRELDAGLQELDCRTPEGTPGSKVVTTQNLEAQPVNVTGSFTYVDAATDFEGGLSGDPLRDRLEVTVFDEMFGLRLPSVNVLLDTGSSAEHVAVTDIDGVAVFAGELGPQRNVTVVARCVQPLTVVDVAVDTVVLYVSPILSPECLPPSFDLPQFGGGGAGAPPRKTVQGELSWGTGIELRRASWRNVPRPLGDTEAQVAYVFELASSSRAEFRLPSRFDAVTPDATGALGYGFEYVTRGVSNLTLYALAGIETQGDRRFTPYSMGLIKGIDPNDPDTRSIMPMDIVLDHRLTVDVVAPQPTAQGPDRVNLTLSLRVGRSGFIPLPHTRRSVLLPLEGPVEFVGVPPLVNALTGAEYVVTATAVNGPGGSLPVADVEALATRRTDENLVIDGFIGMPLLVTPARHGSWSGAELEVDGEIAGSFDLWSYAIEGASGLFSWRIVAPRQRTRVALPDLGAFEHPLPRGPLHVEVSAARVRNFDYTRLPQRAFRPGGWAAHSTDRVRAYLE